jgi:hypothetical protein
VHRLSFKTLFLIVVFLLIPIVLMLRLRQQPHPTAAGWWDETWTYRQRIDFSATGSSTLTDFQVSFSIGTSALINAGKMQSDCDDIRITDQNGNLIPYWIEEGNPGCNATTDTKIWIKAPSLPLPAPQFIFIMVTHSLLLLQMVTMSLNSLMILMTTSPFGNTPSCEQFQIIPVHFSLTTKIKGTATSFQKQT